MVASRDILRGTFRLSIVAAALAAAYSAFVDWQEIAEARQRSLEMVFTYECGARHSDDELMPHLNGFTVDLSKVACSSRPFYASLDELRQAREGTLRREILANSRTFRMDVEGTNAAGQALLWFVLINLLGLAFLGARGVFRWIADGFNARAR